jgi:hypothetical protein
MIVPSEFPAHRKNEFGEKEVYDALAKLSNDIVIFYHVPIQLRGKDGSSKEKEFDFLIADLRGGRFNALLIVEAKAGSFIYNSKTQEWTRSKVGQNDLVTELTAKTHAFAQHFNNLLAPVPIGWCLWFSSAQDTNKSWYPPSILNHQVIDYTGRIAPNEHVARALDGLRQSLPTRLGTDLQAFEKLKSTLLRGVVFFETLRSRFDLDEQKYLALTEEQIDNYKTLLENKRILMRGCAGSGKTLIAQKLAIDLAESGERVLVLCFNRMLADSLQQRLKAYAHTITVNTFHSFAEQQIKKMDSVWWNAELKTFETQNNKSQFFEYVVGLKFLESIEELKGSFDTLIIDEAQDMKQDWIMTLYSLVKPEGRISIFLDEQQNIFQRFKGIPEENSFTKQRLSKNCRNTKKINDFIARKTGLPIESREGVPEGIKVKELSYSSFSNLGDVLRREISDLLEKGKLKPNEVLILINGANTELYKIHELSDTTIQLVEFRAGNDRSSNCIYYTTVSRFKGMESPALILIDADEPKDVKSKARFYVQASRAKNYLITLSKEPTS